MLPANMPEGSDWVPRVLADECLFREHIAALAFAWDTRGLVNFGPDRFLRSRAESARARPPAR
jgi:hypothetical protein